MNNINIDTITQVELDHLELENYRSKDQLHMQLQLVNQNLATIAQEQARRVSLGQVNKDEKKTQKQEKKGIA